MNEQLDNELEFLRPIFHGFETQLEQLIKIPVVKNLKICLFPVKCSYSKKSLFLKKAVKVKILDSVWEADSRTRYYDPNTFTYLKLML